MDLKAGNVDPVVDLSNLKTIHLLYMPENNRFSLLLGNEFHNISPELDKELDRPSPYMISQNGYEAARALPLSRSTGREHEKKTEQEDPQKRWSFTRGRASTLRTE